MYKVLLADDEPFILEGLPTIINWEEHNLEIAGTAYNGLEAIDIINNTNINILITDIRMPKMDGLELIKYIKNSDKHIKIIILSGYDDFKYVKEAAKLGIENYLLKPIDEKELTLTLIDTVSKIEKELYKDIIYREERNVLKDNILNMWVTGSISDSDLKEKADLLNIQIHEQGFIAAVLKIIIPAHTGEINIIDINNLRFAVINICKEIISVNFNSKIFYNLNGELIIIFIGHDYDNKKSEIEKKLYECIFEINTLLKVDVFISIGGFEKDYRTLYKSHAQAKKMQEFSLILGQNKVSSFYFLPENTTRKDFDLQKYILNITSSVKNRDVNAVLEIIDEIFEQIKTLSFITPAFIQNTVTEILFSIINTIRTLNKDSDAIFNNTSSILSSVYDIKNMEELKLWLTSLITNYFEAIINKVDKKNPLINKILNYTNHNFNKNINLKTVAAEFDLNSFYLGQLFKKETEKTFTDYLNSVRIDKAKELLLIGDYKTNEIASMVGYSNSNYFFTIFKKITGMSPSEFRDEL